MKVSAWFRRTSVGLLAAGAIGCGDGEEGKGGGADEYRATIRWTSHGIPHIVADDFASAGFGAAYAEGRFNVCILADQIVRVRSERAQFFGPGDDDDNITQDFGILAANVYEDARTGFETISEELQAGIRGYVAGYNQFLEDTDPADLPSQCAGADWVRPISAEDLFAYYYLLALRASVTPFIDFIANAAPPDQARQTQSSTQPLDFRFSDQPLGSNGWAIGKDRSESGNAMVLSNPHFPWEGNLRFWEKHITIPGELDVYGTSLVGVAIVNIGFNRNVAWTHTVTTARHFTLYSLELAPGKPTTYLYDGEEREMTSRDLSIQVQQPDGSMQEVTRTFWRSHYGLMVSLPQLGGWSDTTAFTVRDANEGNFAIGDQWLALNRAASVQDIVDANEQVHGIPWVNTMAADDQGNALYIDSSRTPNLSAAALTAYETALQNDLLTGAVDSAGATLLNGSDSMFEWVDDGAAAEASVPISRSPTLVRTDYVANANDSHWLSNSIEPLEGFSRLFGAERTPRSPRTRMNLFMLDEATATGASGNDGKFSFEELQAVQFNNRGSIAELLKDAVVARCAGAAPVPVDGQMLDVGPACVALSSWDGQLNLDSVGAIVWREFLESFADGLRDAGALFESGFDPNDPVATPNTLTAAPQGEPDPVLTALATAVQVIESAGFTVTTALGDAQFAPRGSSSIPIHGGSNREGAFNIIGYTGGNSTLLPRTERGATLSDSGLTSDGYIVNVGASTMMVTELTPDGPRARSVVSYSQAPDPGDAEFHADQTMLFSQEQRREVLFEEADILADPNYREVEVSAPR